MDQGSSQRIWSLKFNTRFFFLNVYFQWIAENRNSLFHLKNDPSLSAGNSKKYDKFMKYSFCFSQFQGGLINSTLN